MMAMRARARRGVRGRIIRRRLTVAAAVAVAAATVGAVTTVEALPASATAAPSLPTQPTSGPGSNGPCTSTSTSVDNPAAFAQKIIVFSPGGTAATPVTGGTCNDAKRPVVVVIHGLLAGIDSQLIGNSLLYGDVIKHFVSTGNVVVFASYETDPDDFHGSFGREDAALALAPKYAPRGDFSRLGIVGHSMGGGAVPYIAQRAVARDWGSKSLWLFALAPAFMADRGPVSVPAHTRVVVANYDGDNFIDMRLGIQQFNAYALPDAQKKHLTVHSQTRGKVKLEANHLSPNSLIAPNGPVHFFAIGGVGDALESCSLLGQNCDADLGYMGRWSDGQPVTPGLVSNHPVDVGPKADALALAGLVGECDARLNVRAAECPPSSLSAAS
jgi:hypothetical protein